VSSYSGKVVAITGAAHGLGAALAEDALSQGAQLALCDIAPELETRWEGNAAVHTSLVDVSDREAVARWAQEVQERFGRCDVLINNAGLTVVASFEDHRIEDWERVLGVNLWGTIYCVRCFLPMLQVSKGHITNISSIFGVVAAPGQSAYCTSKFAVRGFSESLWEELRYDDISLTVVHPGGIATRIVAHATTRNRLWADHVAKHIKPRFQRDAMSPEAAAARILRATHKRQRRLILGREGYLFDWMKRLMPVRGNSWAFRGLRRALRLHELEDSDGKLLLEARGESE
jgi:NAD(P)-dependent dehydrogenase (short-subunit alcohol dehydrogenase family)